MKIMNPTRPFRHKILSHPTVLFLLVSGVMPLWGQPNLILNNGFENGLTGWSSFWNRTPGAGSVKIVSDFAHNGGHSAFIEHHDSQDWSFAVNKRYPVKAGEIYEYSAWVRLNLAEWLNLSVITYDKNQQVIDWSFAARNISLLNDEFVLYTTRFIVPDDVYYFNPRFIGGGDCQLYIDDVSLILKGTNGDPKQFSLENNALNPSLPLWYVKILKI
jgi:hypothetical protein